VIPSPLEIARAVYGAWRLAHLDTAGMNFFDRSVEGFWKSFFAAVLVLPGYALLLMMHATGGEDYSAGPARILAVESLTYVIAWVAFPLVMFYLTQNIGRSGEYIGFIVAYNWAQVIEIAAYLPVKAVTAGHLLPDPVGGFLSMAVHIVVLAYEWFIARTALRISGPGAAGIVILALALVIIVEILGAKMLR
jgi:hypothetical protein